jgi:hypothetical protein
MGVSTTLKQALPSALHSMMSTTSTTAVLLHLPAIIFSPFASKVKNELPVNSVFLPYKRRRPGKVVTRME